MRWRRLVMLVVAVAPVVGMAATADAGDGNNKGWKKVHVDFTPTGPGESFADPFCHPANPSQCAVLGNYPDVTQTGDVVGTTIQGDVYLPTARRAVCGRLCRVVRGNRPWLRDRHVRLCGARRARRPVPGHRDLSARARHRNGRPRRHHWHRDGESRRDALGSASLPAPLTCSPWLGAELRDVARPAAAFDGSGQGSTTFGHGRPAARSTRLAIVTSAIAPSASSVRNA